jgi:hypothetical protein
VKLDPTWIGCSWDKSSPSNSLEKRLTTNILAPRPVELASSTLKLRLGASEGMAHEKNLHFLREIEIPWAKPSCSLLLFRLEKGIDWLVKVKELKRLHGQNGCHEQSKLAEVDCGII